jgi:hypothetical protein
VSQLRVSTKAGQLQVHGRLALREAREWCDSTSRYSERLPQVYCQHPGKPGFQHNSPVFRTRLKADKPNMLTVAHQASSTLKQGCCACLLLYEILHTNTHIINAHVRTRDIPSRPSPLLRGTSPCISRSREGMSRVRIRNISHFKAVCVHRGRVTVPLPIPRPVQGSVWSFLGPGGGDCGIESDGVVWCLMKERSPSPPHSKTLLVRISP